jgi:hypothetical protein
MVVKYLVFSHNFFSNGEKIIIDVSKMVYFDNR